MDTVFNIQFITVHISSIECILKPFETVAKSQMQIEMCDSTTEFGFIHFQTIHNDKSPTSLFIMSL